MGENRSSGGQLVFQTSIALCQRPKDMPLPSKQPRQLSLFPFPPHACPGPSSASRGWWTQTLKLLAYISFLFWACHPAAAVSIAYLLSQNYMYHMTEADYHMGIRSSALPCSFCSFLMIHLAFSSFPIHRWIHSYCMNSFLLQRQFSTPVLKSRLELIKYWTEQWRGLTWDDSYMTMHTGAGGNTQPPPLQHSHIYSRERWLEETSSGQETRTPAGSRGANNSSFPPFLLALITFILPDPDTWQKDVTTSETNSNSGYFLYLFKQCQCWIYFPQKDSRLSRTGWFLHQRTKNHFGPSQTTQITSKGRGEPHPGLAI